LDSLEAAELADLDVTARQLERFETSGLLNQVILTRLRSVIQVRRRQLQGSEPAEIPIFEVVRGPLQTPDPAKVESSEQVSALAGIPPDAIAKCPPAPPEQRLEQLLLQCGDPATLSPSQRVNALLWFGQAAEERLAAMPGPAQLALARLLWAVRRPGDALQGYRRLLTACPHEPAIAQIALEAGQRAAEVNQPETAVWFLELALARGLSERDNCQAQGLLQRLHALGAPREAAPRSTSAAPASEPGVPEVATVAGSAAPVLDDSGPGPCEEMVMPPARAPRRSLGEVLAAFMEERNILWGELVGGLLIVGCSIALVISLWKTLEEIPYFPFLILAGITTALYGAGLYTLHHWKLESTSRGLLVIATLLVPLNFMVMAGLSKEEVGGPLPVLIAALTLALFGWLLGLAAAVFVPHRRWPLPLAVLGASASQLLVPPLLGTPTRLGWFVALGTLPVLFFAAGMAGLIAKVVRERPLQRNQVTALFSLLGMAGFALAVAFGFLVFFGAQDSSIREALNRLAGDLALAGIPILATGLLVHRGLESPRQPATGSEPSDVDFGKDAPDKAESWAGLSLSVLRTGGTAALLLGILVMLLGVLFAWPQPVALSAVCAWDAAVLTWVAFRFTLPAIHAAAIPCLAVGYLSGFYLAAGLTNIRPGQLGGALLHQTAFGWGGTALILPVALLAGAAEVCAGHRRRSHAVFYAVGALALALTSWALVNFNGLRNPERSALVSSVYGVGMLALNVRWRRPLVSYLGVVLLFSGTVWALEWQGPLIGPVLAGLPAEVRAPRRLGIWSAVLALEALALGALGAGLARGRLRVELRRPNASPLGEAAISPTPNAYLAQPLAGASEWIGWLAIGAGLLSGWLLPWQLAHAGTGAALLIQYVILAAAARSIGLARDAGWVLIGTVIAAAGWAAHSAAYPAPTALIAASLAATSILMAVVSVRATRTRRMFTGPAPETSGPDAAPWFAVFAPAWRETSAVAALLSLGLCLPPSSVPDSALYPGTLAGLAVTALLLAWRYQTATLTWVGSILFLAGIVHALYWHLPVYFGIDRVLIALLGHATAMTFAGIGVRARSPDHTSPVRRVYGGPLLGTALVSSILAGPLLLSVTLPHLALLAGCAAWLALVWLALAWRWQAPGLFTAHQVMLAIGLGYAVTGWLEVQTWLRNNYPEGLTDPRSLHAYGIALAAFCLVWMLVRLGLRRDERAYRFLELGRCRADCILLGLLVVGQLGLAVWGILPGVLKELAIRGMLPPELSAWPETYTFAYGQAAWALLAIVAAALGAGFWQARSAAGPVLGLVIIAATVPFLAAGSFAAESAAASALRWGLAICFLVCASGLWCRVPIGRLAVRLRIPAPGQPALTQQVRWLLYAGLAGPAIWLTLLTAVPAFLGTPVTCPDPDSVFARAGLVVSFSVPLLLIGVGLVGEALREGTAGYAFAAGLVANLTLMGSYGLASLPPRGTLSEVHWVRLLEWGALGTAIWALAWVFTRRRVGAWRVGPENRSARPLMVAQISISLFGMGLLLILALGTVVTTFPSLFRGGNLPIYLPAPAWVFEVGSTFGWAALTLALAAAVFRDWPAKAGLLAHSLGFLVLAVIGLVACTLERFGPGQGYRMVLVGSGAWALGVSLGAWSVEQRTAAEKRSALPGAIAAAWVRATGVLVLLLGLKAAIWHQDPLWAAAAVALASFAGATMAVWRRNPGWAFTAGLGVNLAASLVVWHSHRDQPLADWVVLLVQANIIANAVCSLLWLALRRWLEDLEEFRRTAGPLLFLQIGIGCAASAVLLLVPLAFLVLTPGQLPPGLESFGAPWGWLAFGLAVAAAFWHLDQAAARIGAHLVGALGMALGVLMACTLARWDTGNWLTYHALMAAWTLAGATLLVGGWWLSHRWSSAGRGVLGGTDPDPLTAAILYSPAKHVQRWVAAIGLGIVLLAVRGGLQDPGRPYWPAAATLAAGGLAAGLSLWSGRAAFVYISGFLVNLAGTLTLSARGPVTPAALTATNILCLALASALWSVVELGPARRLRWPDRQGRALPFSHFAAALALAIQVLFTVVGLGSDLSGGGLYLVNAPAWAAFGAVGGALLLCCWDARARFALPGLYLFGLLGCAWGLHGIRLSPPYWVWGATVAFSSYVLITAVAAATWFRNGPPGRAGELSTSPWLPAWYLAGQGATACVVVCLSFWLVFNFPSIEGRLAAPVALALLFCAGLVLAEKATGTWAAMWRLGALALGVAAVAGAGWAAVEPAGPAPWLHRSVVGLAVLVVMTFLYGHGLPRALPAGSLWAAGTRRLRSPLACLTCLAVLGVLVQQAFLFDPATKTTPLLPWAIAAVAGCLAVMVAAGIWFAVSPGSDPWGLSERGRRWYVYGSELLLVLMFVHLRLNMPGLVGTFAARYWTLIVMALAFLGVGLSEHFQRKGLTVLAEPLRRTGLFLPLLPLLAFWFQPPAAVQEFAREKMPGVAPLLRSVRRPPGGFGSYAILWFLLGLLYTAISVAQRSFWFGFLAALAVNLGLWSMLFHYGWQFLVHPQLWLIPLALILLVSEHINRDRLGPARSASLRYLALGLLYLSSTADMFITGVGNSVVLPLILAVLSVLGVLAGIVLRVRAFLFLGVSFLFLVVFSMIWHAAVDRTQTWVWWASGIVLGVGIVALFALFEKRRNDVLRLIEEIKKWD
jgi:hypothetical protein